MSVIIISQICKYKSSFSKDELTLNIGCICWQHILIKKMKHPSLLICSFSHLISEYISLAGESVELDNILFNHNCFENWLFYSECVEKPYSSIILNKIIFVMFYMNIYCILIFIVEFCTILVHYIYNFLFFSNCSYQSLFVNLNCLHS